MGGSILLTRGLDWDPRSELQYQFVTGSPVAQCRVDGRLVDWDGLTAVPPSLSFSLWWVAVAGMGSGLMLGFFSCGPSVSGR
jgi:hypothetical protein